MNTETRAMTIKEYIRQSRLLLEQGLELSNPHPVIEGYIQGRLDELDDLSKFIQKVGGVE